MTWWEYVSCLWEREWWAQMRLAWSLYVDLGERRRALARMVQRETAQIPKG